MTTQITLTTPEQEALVMIVMQPNIAMCCGKSPKSKKYARGMAVYTLADKGLITKTHRSGYNYCTATESGLELAKTLKGVKLQSEAMRERQDRRTNGKYEQYEVCDCCSKKRPLYLFSYDEIANEVRCNDCLTPTE